MPLVSNMPGITNHKDGGSHAHIVSNAFFLDSPSSPGQLCHSSETFGHLLFFFFLHNNLHSTPQQSVIVTVLTRRPGGQVNDQWSCSVT